MSAPPADAGIVIVGASLAGLRGAEALRDRGFSGKLTIVGDEPCRPYDRPPLSKHVIAGELAADATELPRMAGLSAEWRLGHAAVGLDRSARTVRLADGATLAYDKLLLATGAQARPWPDPQAARLAGLFTLRTRGDAEALRLALAARPRRVLIIGAGLIGCEAASSCRDLGLAVTLADPNRTPLARSLGETIGRTIVERLAAAGVDFRPRAKITALEGDEDGHVRAARFAAGETLEVDAVIVALGAVREVGWLVEAGLAADAGGLTCDAACRAISTDGRPDPHVYAAGDLARWPNALDGGRLIAVEHWGNAVEQARHAARNMLAGADDQRPYRHLPAFWSSQFGVNVKCVGLADGADAVAVVQGSRASHRFLAVYGHRGRSIAAVSFDQARWLPAYAGLIEAGAPFPPILGASDQPRVERLDPGFPPPRRPARTMSGGAHV